MPRFCKLIFSAAVLVGWSASAVEAQVCCMKGNANDRLEVDLDGDGFVDETFYDFRVNGEDIHNFVSTYLIYGSVSPQADCASDMDSDGDVDDADVPLFVAALLDPTGLICDYVNNCFNGPLVYPPSHPNVIATRIAYDNISINVNEDPFNLGTNAFFVPNAVIDRIARDFDDIVALSGDFDEDGTPDLTGQGPNQTLFSSNAMLIRLHDPLGANPDYECLNTFFGINSANQCMPPCTCGGCCLPEPNDPPPTCTSGCVRCIFGCNMETFRPGDLHIRVHYFPTDGRINIPLIGAMYGGAVEEVAYAEPDHCIGGVNNERNIWKIENFGGFWEWTIEHGFQDCFDGCDCRVIYTAFTDDFGDQPFVSLPPTTEESLPGTCTFFATPTGACCVDFGGFVECFQQTMEDCFTQNAGAPSISYLGNGTSCTPAPCGPRGACCLGETCNGNVTVEQCTAQGGEFLGVGISCEGNPCQPFGACCVPAGGCIEASLSDCNDINGFFWGDEIPCQPGLCS